MKKVTLKAIKNMVGYDVYTYEELDNMLSNSNNVQSKEIDYVSVGVYGRNGLCSTVVLKDGTVHKIKITERNTELFLF